MSPTDPMGETKAVIRRIPRQTRKMGFRIFPIQVRILPGFKENQSTTPKNTRENKVRGTGPGEALLRRGEIPTSKGTVAHLGMAKKGPMVRYRTQVKNMLYFFPTRSLS